MTPRCAVCDIPIEESPRHHGRRFCGQSCRGFFNRCKRLTRWPWWFRQIRYYRRLLDDHGINHDHAPGR